MGSQIRFYMNRVDEQVFWEHLQKTTSFTVMNTLSQTSEPEYLEWQCLSEEQTEVWIWNHAFGGSPKMKPMMRGAGYLLDIFDSSAVLVQFNRCHRRSGQFMPGRLWCEPRQFEEYDAGKKWFIRVSSWLRRQAGGARHRGVIVLPDTYREAQETGFLP